MNPLQQPYETQLTPTQEWQYRLWKKKMAPNDSGADYDLRGAFLKGLQPGGDAHWSDEFKKPSHPRFSDQSMYANEDNSMQQGHWFGQNYAPPAVPNMAYLFSMLRK